MIMSRLVAEGIKRVKRNDTRHGRKYAIVWTDRDGVEHEESLLSTTTRLEALHNEHLVSWRIRFAEETAKTAAMLAFQDGMDKTSFLLAFESAYAAEKKRRKVSTPANIGTDIHNAIEATCLAMMRGESIERPPCTSEEVANGWDNWWRWAQAVRLKPWAVELPIFNPKCAGTLDFIGEVEEHVVIADWKTGKRLYPEYDLQIADYARSFRYMSAQGLLRFDGDIEIPEIDGAAIVHVPKTEGEIVRPRVRQPADLDADLFVFDSICNADSWAREHALKQPLAVSAF